MIKVLSAEEMREVDRLTTEKYGIPSILLMENAAHAAARIIAEKLGGLVAGKSFLILCGKGNNGGDGAALARILWTIGKKVVVVLFGKVEDTKGDARTNFQILQKIDSEKLHGFLDFIELAEIDFETSFHTIFYNRGFSGGPYGVVVDALFGTGLTRPLDEKFSYVTKILNNKQKWKQSKNEYLLVSLDVPSGLNADSAEAIGENVHADLTVTFTAPKIANVMSPASNFNGELFIADIGSRTLLRNVEPKTYVTDSQKICGFLCETQVRTDSYKKTRGTALILAGSEDFSGAAVLAANACFSAGAGMVSVGVPQTVKDIVASKVADEIIVKTLEYTNVSNEKVDVIALGCGLASDETTRKFVREIVENRQTPIVLDAEALNALAPFDLQGSNEFPLILTPHIGEFKRLLGNEEIKDRIKTAREFAEKHSVILVLKGERSLIVKPDGYVVINPTGNAGISRAGAGDTLTGIITSFLAQTFAIRKSEAEDEETNLDKAFWGVVSALYIAGLAGDIAAERIGQRLMTASDIRHYIREAIIKIDDRENISLGINQ